MQVELTSEFVQRYADSLDAAVKANHSAYDSVPSWGNYVGNGHNDAWVKADAALKTWPQLSPAYAKIGAFPRTPTRAAKAAHTLRTLAALEAKAKMNDPLHVGFSGDPEQAAAFDHDFEHGAAAAAHDLKGEISANDKFASRSLDNSAAAFRRGDVVNGERDEGAAVFIGIGGSVLDRKIEGAFPRSSPTLIPPAAPGRSGGSPPAKP